MNSVTIQQVKLFVLKIYRNSKYLPYNRKKIKHAVLLTYVTKVMSTEFELVSNQ